jgi:hypothetical protein
MYTIGARETRGHTGRLLNVARVRGRDINDRNLYPDRFDHFTDRRFLRQLVRLNMSARR